MSKGNNKQDLRVKSLVEHLDGECLEYFLERAFEDQYKSQLPIVGSDGRVLLAEVEVLWSKDNARVSANKIPMGNFKLASLREEQDRIFMYYIQHCGRLEILGISAVSLAATNATLQTEVKKNLYVAPTIETPEPQETQALRKALAVEDPETKEEPKAIETLEAKVAIKLEPVVEREEAKPIIECPVEIYRRQLADNLAIKLASRGLIIPSKTEVVLEGRTYGPDNTFKYGQAAEILGKTAGSLVQYVRTNNIPIKKGITAANVLKIQLFDSATPSIYDRLNLAQLVSLYGAEMSLVREVQRQGLFEKGMEYKTQRNPRVLRQGQKQFFYGIFDEVMENLRNGKIVYEGEIVAQSNPSTISTREAPRLEVAEEPKIEPTSKRNGEVKLPAAEYEEAESIRYSIVYTGEGERKATEKTVEVYQPEFNRRKLEKLVSSKVIDGNMISVGEEVFTLDSLIGINRLSSIFGRSPKNVQRRCADLPELLKRMNGRDLAVTPFAALVLYSAMDLVMGPVELETAAQDLLLDPRTMGADRNLINYMKQAGLIKDRGALQGDRLLITPHDFYTLSKSLRHNWASTMSEESKRKQFMGSIGYLDENTAIHELTGNGFPIDDAYRAIGEKLKPHVVLGMIPRESLSQIQI